jgi:hypothetical protein
MYSCSAVVPRKWRLVSLHFIAVRSCVARSVAEQQLGFGRECKSFSGGNQPLMTRNNGDNLFAVPIHPLYSGTEVARGRDGGGM